MPFVMNDRPPPPAALTKTDATALWHAVREMSQQLTAMRRMSAGTAFPAEVARLQAAGAALRKVQAMVRKPKAVKP
jgi:hypothetical protein